MTNGTSEGKEFLGAGIAFPLRVDGEGHLMMNSLEDQVRQSILLIIQTMKGDRMMRPDFGASLQKYVFSPATATTAAIVEHEVNQALVRYEPRIEVISVKGSYDAKQPGLLLVNVQYRVRRTDTQFNLVYPFYLERGES